MFRLPAARNPAADAEHLRLALDAAQLGAWDYDATTGATTISPRFEEILGLAPGGFGGTLADLVERIHPDDRGVIELGRRFGLEHNLDIHVEYRIVRPDGEVRWLEGRGSLRTDDAEVVGSLGVVMDVTERRLAEQRREALAAGLALQTRAAELLIDLDARNRVSDLADVLVPALADCCAVYLVERDEIRLAGARHAEPEHEPAFRELLETVPASVDQPYGAGAVIRTGEPQLLAEVPDEILVQVAGERPESLAGFRALRLQSGVAVPMASRGRVLGALTLGRTRGQPWSEDDLTLAEQVATTAAIALDNAHLYAAERAARAAAERNERRLGLLAEVTTTLVQTLDLDQVLDALAALLVPRLAELCTIDLADDDRTRRVAARAADPAALTALMAAEARLPRRANEATAVARVIRTGAPLLVAEVTDDYLRERSVDPQQFAHWRSMQIRSAVVAPVTARGQVLGAISLLSLGAAGRRFSPDDVDLLVEIGRRAGMAIDNARLYGREHVLAEGLQRSLLPELQALPGLDVAARYLPSSDHAQIGGDWFDAFPLADGAVGIAVGDAMGHDPRASGAMGQLRSVLRSYAFEGAPPGVVLDKLDQLVQGFSMAQLATVFYGRLEPPAADGTRVLRYCSAGHPPPALRQPDGSTTLLEDGQSIVIGVPVDRVERPEGVLTLRPASLLVAYTDGLVEGRRRPIDDGIATLRRTLETLSHASAEAACDGIVTALVDAARDDDIALLVVRPA